LGLPLRFVADFAVSISRLRREVHESFQLYSSLLQRYENPGLRELNFHFARQQTGFDLDQPPEFFFGPCVWIQMFKRLPYSPLNYFHNLTEKRRPAKTIEHCFLDYPSILHDLLRKFATFE